MSDQIGGAFGGVLNEHFSLAGVFLGMLPLLLIWLALVATMEKPKHLTSYMMNLAEDQEGDDQLEEQLLSLRGVYEVMIMPQEQAAYLKVDNGQFDPAQLKSL